MTWSKESEDTIIKRVSRRLEKYIETKGNSTQPNPLEEDATVPKYFQNKENSGATALSQLPIPISEPPKDPIKTILEPDKDPLPPSMPAPEKIPPSIPLQDKSSGLIFSSHVVAQDSEIIFLNLEKDNRLSQPREPKTNASNHAILGMRLGFFSAIIFFIIIFYLLYKYNYLDNIFEYFIFF